MLFEFKECRAPMKLDMSDVIDPAPDPITAAAQSDKVELLEVSTSQIAQVAQIASASPSSSPLSPSSPSSPFSPSSSSSSGELSYSPFWNVPDSVWLTGAHSYWVDGHFGRGVVVGVIDSGIDDTHPVLAGRVLRRRNYTDELAISPSKHGGHGTHVAGTIGARPVPGDSDRHNLAGVAPGVVFHDYRVINSLGGTSVGVLAQAVRDATADGCDIINMSLAGTRDYPELHAAIKGAREAGVTIICAAGNTGSGRSMEQILEEDEVTYPAVYDETLAVACVDLNMRSGELRFVPFSATNAQIDVAADGYRLLSAWPGDRYVTISGTSMACPCVTGIAALLFGKISAICGRHVAKAMNLHALLKAEAVRIFDHDDSRDNVVGYGLCTLFSEIPKYVDGRWSLSNLSSSAPKR